MSDESHEQAMQAREKTRNKNEKNRYMRDGLEEMRGMWRQLLFENNRSRMASNLWLNFHKGKNPLCYKFVFVVRATNIIYIIYKYIIT